MEDNQNSYLCHICKKHLSETERQFAMSSGEGCELDMIIWFCYDCFLEIAGKEYVDVLTPVRRKIIDKEVKKAFCDIEWA